MMRLVSALLGALAGLIVVRVMFLGPIEIMGWTMFWEFVGEGGTPDLEVLIKSSTFMKSAVGLLAGAVLGFAVAEVVRTPSGQATTRAGATDDPSEAQRESRPLHELRFPWWEVGVAIFIAAFGGLLYVNYKNVLSKDMSGQSSAAQSAGRAEDETPPAGHASSKSRAAVFHTRCSLRESAAISARKVGRIERGERVELLSQAIVYDRVWFKVRGANAQVGWAGCSDVLPLGLLASSKKSRLR